MILRKALVAVVSFGALAACSSEPKSSHDANAGLDESTSMFDPEAPGVPKRCSQRSGRCLPPAEWARNLCEDIYEDLALYMFQRGTPWKRLYMNTGLNAVNGWGTTLHEKLEFSEEVLLVAYRDNQGMVQTEDSDGTYDVLRWNGNCVTVDVNQVTESPPSEPLNATIDWWKLSNEMRTRLMENQEVAQGLELETEACKGASVGRPRGDCDGQHKEFMKTVAVATRRAQDLPAPSKTPRRPQLEAALER